MNKPISRSAAGGRASRRAEAGAQAKVFPPDSPVDVPNLPRKPKGHARDAAAQASQPAEDAQTESSWADNTQPAPNKKNVRSSNIF
jgi:hypothetical protein